MKASGVVGAMAFSSLGNEAKAETPKNKDYEEVKKEYHMSQEMPSSKLFSNVNDVQLDSMSTPEMLDHFFDYTKTKITKKLANGETEISARVGNLRVSKVVDPDGSYFFGLAEFGNGGMVKVNYTDGNWVEMPSANGVYNLCMEKDGGLYVPDYRVDNDGYVERTGVKKTYKGNKEEFHAKFRDMIKDTMNKETVRRAKANNEMVARR